jgi:hypothetical protein
MSGIQRGWRKGCPETVYKGGCGQIKFTERGRTHYKEILFTLADRVSDVGLLPIDADAPSSLRRHARGQRAASRKYDEVEEEIESDEAPRDREMEDKPSLNSRTFRRYLIKVKCDSA